MPTFRNPQYQDLMQGFRDRMSAIGQPWKLLRTGETFKAIAIRVPPVDPALELGSDWREMFTLEAERDLTPVGIKYGDIIQQSNPPFNNTGWSETRRGSFLKFPISRVVRRENNPADFAIKYWCQVIPEEEEAAVYAQLGIAPPPQATPFTSS